MMEETKAHLVSVIFLFCVGALGIYYIDKDQDRRMELKKLELQGDCK